MSCKLTSPPKVSKKVSPYKHAWVADGNFAYVLNIDGLVTARIWQWDDGTWQMRIKFAKNPVARSGERPTLEEAFKASDRLLHKHLPHVWTVTDARAIISSWKGDLNL
jgi:hypothetical protein